ncbi:MAG: ATP-binding cassette domain-containing protein [Candidatus Shapirobacteria bacterium]|jgi:ABC-type polysaccharide/polyol phosphate transport system ATPase subunit
MTGSKKNNEVHVQLTDVYKRYSPAVGSHLRNQKTRLVLSEVTIEINKGERVGLIGSNGAGKTTLLKVIAGISKISSGKLVVNGRVNSLMELGAGFYPDLTGRENILLNGMLAGASRKEVRRSMNDIIKFSGIAKFIDYPFYTYSAGMKLRLAFSVAIHASPDILLFDEIVAMGDEKFIKTFQDYFSRVLKEKKTVIFATHVLDVLPLYCNRVIWMDEGKVRMDGETKKVIEKYKKEMKKRKDDS